MALGVASVTAPAIWIVVAQGLWERPSARSDPQRVKVANAVTALTLLIGLTCFYVALFVLVLLSALLVIDDGYLGSTLRHAVGFGDYATLAWFTASLATVGGRSDRDWRPTSPCATRSTATDPRASPTRTTPLA